MPYMPSKINQKIPDAGSAKEKVSPSPPSLLCVYPDLMGKCRCLSADQGADLLSHDQLLFVTIRLFLPFLCIVPFGESRVYHKKQISFFECIYLPEIFSPYFAAVLQIT